MEITITEKTVRELLRLVSFGLISGGGSGKPGDMCVEQAISIAIEGARPMDVPKGIPIPSDQPRCVAPEVSGYKIALNDQSWVSEQTRAEGLKRIAVAQIGSNKLDGIKFLEKVADKTYKVTGRRFEENEYYMENPEEVLSYVVHVAPGIGDEKLRFAARIGLEVLQEMESQGCKFLHLVK